MCVCVRGDNRCSVHLTIHTIDWLKIGNLLVSYCSEHTITVRFNCIQSGKSSITRSLVVISHLIENYDMTEESILCLHRFDSSINTVLLCNFLLRCVCSTENKISYQFKWTSFERSWANGFFSPSNERFLLSHKVLNRSCQLFWKHDFRLNSIASWVVVAVVSTVQNPKAKVWNAKFLIRWHFFFRCVY